MQFTRKACAREDQVPRRRRACVAPNVVLNRALSAQALTPALTALPREEREKCRRGVLRLRAKVRGLHLFASQLHCTTTMASPPMTLPDLEIVAAEVHAAWMASKRAQGFTSRQAEDGEELMVSYERLSEKAKDLDRNTVRAVYAAIERAAAQRR
jgi:hypothetical protein